ncbi:MAG TPA: hypothetical protein VKZ79_00520 [Alphaproteobacteria bacterium]|nr:hypothetical protein [Alphaproteobacteria bacterium]
MDALEVSNAQDYRRMAARCREMASLSTRPAALLRRAEAFELIAAGIEQGVGHAIGEKSIPTE